MAKIKDYEVYGHDRGTKQKDRYLFSVSATTNDGALILARRRVKGAKVITRVILKYKPKRKRGSEDTRQRRKFQRGGRIEAYTFGDAERNPDWPFHK